MLVDSGSAVTILPWKLVKQHPQLNQMKVPIPNKLLTTANGTGLNVQWKLPDMQVHYK